jgi:hypothetical protein
MRRRARILLGLGIILVVVIGAVIFFPSSEPTYEGRTLSEWILDYNQFFRDEGFSDPGGVMMPSKRIASREYQQQKNLASNALCQIGPRAVPFLVKWIDYEPPSWNPRLRTYIETHFKKSKVREMVLNRLNQGARRADESLPVFKFLGASAEEAVPSLTKMLNGKKRGPASKAGLALSAIGPKGLPPLMQALADSSRSDRDEIAFRICQMGTNGRPAIPLLIRCFKEPKPTGLSPNTYDAMMNLQPEPGQIIPALIEAIADPKRRVPNAIHDLASFGRAASNAVPALLDALNDPNFYTRAAATSVLQRIDPDALQNLHP